MIMRPSLDDTIDRDERVLALLVSAGPLSKRDIVDRLDLDPSAVFMSLYRLSGQGRVESVAGQSRRVRLWSCLERVDKLEARNIAVVPDDA